MKPSSTHSHSSTADSGDASAKAPRKLRILLTADPGLPVPPPLYGGIERVIDQLAVELRARGHHVALLADAGSTSAVDERFAWPESGGPSQLRLLRQATALRRAVKASRAELVHSFSRLALLGPVLPGALPKIMSYQRHPTERTVRWANRIAGGSLTFTGCSGFLAQLGAAHGGVWRAIPNGVDLARYPFAPIVAEDAPLVFLSRIESIKGADLAIAIARVAKRKLILAGNHATSGAEAEYWQREIAPHLDDKSVRYVGPVNDAQKAELLRNAAALLVPVQWDEPFGIVFIEALACGTPVLSCPRGALPEIVRDGHEGFLAASIDELVRAVARLPQIDRHACRRRVEEHFSIRVIADQYEALYRDRCA